ncbi:hypothetical protein LT493_15610 [Streptomyces tricolor]|nr:hypothetical protein [Streptomyces tricolor]
MQEWFLATRPAAALQHVDAARPAARPRRAGAGTGAGGPGGPASGTAHPLHPHRRHLAAAPRHRPGRGLLTRHGPGTAPDEAAEAARAALDPSTGALFRAALLTGGQRPQLF